MPSWNPPALCLESKLARLGMPFGIACALRRRGVETVGQVVRLSRDELIAPLGVAGLQALAESLIDSGLAGDCVSRWSLKLGEDRQLKKPALWPHGANAWGRCWVYFVRSGRHVKIGVSTAGLSARMGQLQAANPVAIKLWLAIPMASWTTAHKLQTVLHAQFKADHCRSEWFRLSPEIVRFARSERHALRARSVAA